MKPSLQLRLSQHLALTPQLQQSIRLLQLSTLELNQEIEQALNDNPLLERDDDPLAATLRIAADGSIQSAPPAPSPGESSGESPEAAGSTTLNGEASDEHDSGGADSLTEWGTSTRADRDEDDASPLSWAASQRTLREHLREQLIVTHLPQRDRALVGLLIDALDDEGYLTAALEELLALCPPEVQIELDDLTAALRLLQSFDPPGVAARSPAECLGLQLAAMARQPDCDVDPAVLGLASRIVGEHLLLLAGRDFNKLRRLLGTTDELLRAAHHLIRGLNPYPGVGFAGGGADYVVPDVFVRRVRNRWVAQLNPEVMPRLRVNQSYAAIVKRENRGKEGQTPWSTRLQEARWLIRNVQQRFETILRVSQTIVDRQQNFFTHGAVAMRPLVLREVAEQVSLHESTISRVTTNKYMATPFGVFELKYFFGSHVATDSGGAASSTAIRALIKQLIGAEEPKNPLSDSRIAELLGEQGIVVARRTVAKYREALKIAPVAMRKVL
jgi:RNA polymerase sigma-54 factor